MNALQISTPTLLFKTSQIAPGDQLVAPGGQLVPPGGQLVSPGDQLVAPGGQLVSPGDQLVAPGAQNIDTIAVCELHRGFALQCFHYILFY